MARAVLPFGNTLYVLNLTGREIRNTLEIAVSRARDPNRDGAFPYVGGARYRADRTKPEGDRIVGIEIKNASGQWEPIDPNTTYRVATISFLAGGGDGYKIPAEAGGYPIPVLRIQKYLWSMPKHSLRCNVRKAPVLRT